jgi:hypothetical protein
MVCVKWSYSVPHSYLYMCVCGYIHTFIYIPSVKSTMSEESFPPQIRKHLCGTHTYIYTYIHTHMYTCTCAGSWKALKIFTQNFYDLLNTQVTKNLCTGCPILAPSLLTGILRACMYLYMCITWWQGYNVHVHVTWEAALRACICVYTCAYIYVKIWTRWQACIMCASASVNANTLLIMHAPSPELTGVREEACWRKASPLLCHRQPLRCLPSPSSASHLTALTSWISSHCICPW